VSGDLNDSLYVSLALDQKQDWGVMLEILRDCTGNDFIHTDGWLRTLGLVEGTNNTRIFEYIIRHIDGTPDWTPKSFQAKETVLRSYIESKRKELDAVLDRLSKEQWNAKTGRLSALIFGEHPEQMLSYYTPRMAEQFLSRGFTGFIHAEGLSALALFIQVHGKDIQELCELLMIRAVYASNMRPQALMDQNLLLQNLGKSIAEFDASMSSSGSRGYRLYQAIAKSSSDRFLARSIQDSLDVINGEAQSMLIEGSQSFAGIQSAVIAAKNDYDLDPPQLVLNWSVLKQTADRPLAAWLMDTGKRLALFSELMALFIRNTPTPPEPDFP
jgi:hypothetical protein